MELRQIQYFLEVAKREHVTEAAHELHVAQSAISRQIANLESELGVQLFVREGRNVRLTPVARIFMEHVQVAMAEIDKAKQEVYEFLNPETGTIRIGFPNSLAAKTLPTVISAFRNEHPSIGFQLRQGSVKDLTDAVVKGEIDLAFVSPVPTARTEIKGNILFTEKMMGLLPRSHELAEEPAIRLGQLKNDQFVIFRPGYSLRNLVVNACQQVGFKPRVAFEGEDVDTIKGLVSAGLGVSLLPEITLVDNIPPEAVKKEILEPNVTRSVGIIIPTNRELAPTEKKFFEFLKNFYEVLNRFGQ
ncbi:LysR family transcriptional regulator [Pseudalkalibacillus caeni]|uniref:LysR family transcriptional regulator n=1 Tax=Exobacillus caeni TaxID=2574798 RepID=A0A5R9EYZ6_9BACL|nr:LysR family transcriptional regulator [Pseudalkalibacillus caeni]TLS35426.1 LysR family transcriptional regulator [Pseudalkalibacillus caeni]